jgi:hypothetical protein
LLIFAFLGRAGAHSSHFSAIFQPFFISFFLHFYSQLESPGSKNEEKMTQKTSEKWLKIITVSNPNLRVEFPDCSSVKNNIS